MPGVRGTAAGVHGQHDDVVRSPGLDAEDNPTSSGHQVTSKLAVEDVVVHTSSHRVLSDSRFELSARTSKGVSTKIVQVKNLAEVRIVVLGHGSALVGTQVVQRRDRSATVEGAVPVGEHEDEVSILPAHASPFLESSQRIREVLDRVRGHDKVIGRVRDPEQIRGFTQVLRPETSPSRREIATLQEILLPQRGAREVDVVQRRHVAVERH